MEPDHTSALTVDRGETSIRRQQESTASLLCDRGSSHAPCDARRFSQGGGPASSSTLATVSPDPQRTTGGYPTQQLTVARRSSQPIAFNGSATTLSWLCFFAVSDETGLSLRRQQVRPWWARCFSWIPLKKNIASAPIGSQCNIHGNKRTSNGAATSSCEVKKKQCRSIFCFSSVVSNYSVSSTHGSWPWGTIAWIRCWCSWRQQTVSCWDFLWTAIGIVHGSGTRQ